MRAGRTSSKSSGVITLGGGTGIAGTAETAGVDDGAETGIFELEEFDRS